MKNQNCKARVLKWMRHAVDLNLEKNKIMSKYPVASNGFILNYIQLLLLLCKPFTGAFGKYGQFIGKVNCFYLSTNDYLKKAKDFDKIDGSQKGAIEAYLSGSNSVELSGFTQVPVTEASSLDDNANSLVPPNFVTECFFLSHILISFMSNKMEKKYKEVNEQINKAIDDKDMETFNDLIAFKLGLDTHFMNNFTRAHYRDLFSFTNCLIMVIGKQGTKLPKDSFESLPKFLSTMAE